MLIKQGLLEAIAAGDVDLVFRRWARARVKEGSRSRTRVGVLEVTAVDVVTFAGLTDEDARRAGFASRAELVAELRLHRTGRIHRIALRLAGPDPRVALRQRAALTERDTAELAARLARLDAASRHGHWTHRVLRLLARRPGVRAGDLCEAVGRERLAFKRDVRKLKELGLTESLEVGYRLSPRGRALLARLPRGR